MKFPRGDVFLKQIVKGYILIPQDQFGEKRDLFIKRCYRRKRVSVLFDSGGFTNDCPISLSALKEIEFPQEQYNVGSTVLCWIDPISGKPMVFSVFGFEENVVVQNEGETVVESINGDNSAFVNLSSKNGEIFMKASSDASGGGNIFIIASNDAGDSLFKLRVMGDIDVYAGNTISIKSITSITIDTPSFKIGDSLEVTDDSVNLFGGGEPLVLGNTLQNQLNANNTYLSVLQSAISTALGVINAVVPGVSAPYESSMAAATKGDWSNINSSKSFTD